MLWIQLDDDDVLGSKQAVLRSKGRAHQQFENGLAKRKNPHGGSWICTPKDHSGGRDWAMWGFSRWVWVNYVREHD